MSFAILSVACSAFDKSFVVAFTSASIFLSFNLKKAASIPCPGGFAALNPFLIAFNICSSCSESPCTRASFINSSTEALMLLNRLENFSALAFLYCSSDFNCSICHADQLYPSFVSSARCCLKLRIMECINSSSIARNAFSISYSPFTYLGNFIHLISEVPVLYSL